MKINFIFIYFFYFFFFLKKLKVRVFDDIIEVKSDDSFLDNVDFE
jgi:hypothetical protein